MKNNFLINMTPNFEFDDSTLNEKDLALVKNFASEERASYGKAPIGRDIFSFINYQENLRIISYDFNKSAKQLDAMIFKYPSSKYTWIVINGNKPLIYQIFAIAHEYYHFKKDIPNGILGIPCDFESLNEREIKANRFAAEFLLPSDAIKEAINNIIIRDGKFDESNYLNIVMQLSSRYCIPFNVTCFRINEEGFSIKKIKKDFFKDNEDIINNLLKQTDPFKELLNTKNNYLENDNLKLLNQLYLDEYITEIEFITMSKDINLCDEFINSTLFYIEENDESNNAFKIFT